MTVAEWVWTVVAGVVAITLAFVLISVALALLSEIKKEGG